MSGRLFFAPLPRIKPAGGAGSLPQSPDQVQGQEAEGSEERVGMGQPPHSTRFRPGQSGNPSGRSKRARDLAAIAARAFAEKVEVRENGRRRRITKLEASVKQLVNRAAAATSARRSLPLLCSTTIAAGRRKRPSVSARPTPLSSQSSCGASRGRPHERRRAP
jgi:hypothetical protein